MKVRHPGTVRCAARMTALIVGMLSAPQVATAQAIPAPYVLVSDVRPYEGLSDDAQRLAVGGAGTVSIDLPFDLSFFGQIYRTLYVNANGVVGFVPFGNGFNVPAVANPDPGLPNGYIAVLWGDWCTDEVGCFVLPPNPGSGVYVNIDAEREVVRVEWRRVRHFRDAVVATDATFQLAVFGGPTGLIELTYGAITPGRDAIDFETEIRPRIGFESPDGTVGAWFPPCDGSQPCSTRQASFLTETRIRAFQDLGPDLLLDGLQVPSAALPGLPLTVTASTRSGHGNPLGPFRIAAYLVRASTTSTAGAVAVTRSDPTTLEAFAEASLTLDIEVPDDLVEGDYRVVAVIDDLEEVAELDEDNNVVLSDIVAISGRGVDFAAVSLEVDPIELTDGQSVTVDYRIDNLGNEPALLKAQVFLSANDFISTADVPLGAPIMATLGARQSVTSTASVSLPSFVPTGRYSVGLIADVDGVVDELDETNNVFRASVDIQLRSSSLALATQSLSSGRVGLPYVTALRADGGDGTYAFSATGLPPGLALTGSTIAGTPTTAGIFGVDVSVSSAGLEVTERLSIVVDDDGLPLTPVAGALPEGSIGQDYRLQLLAIGGQAPYRWTVLNGRLPQDLAVSAIGELTGTLRSVGVFPIDLVVTDAASAQVTTQVELTVRGGVNLAVLGPNALAAANIDVPYAQALVATGGVPPRTWVAETDLPPGLSLSETGDVVGIPNRVGDYLFRAQVTDALGAEDSDTFRIEVRDDGRLDMAPERLEAGIPNQRYSAVIRGVGGRRPYTWALDGRLPPGMTLEVPDPTDSSQSDADRVIVGTAEAAGLWPIKLTVVDALGRTSERAYVVWIRTSPAEVADDGCRCVAVASPDGWWGLLGLFAALLVFRRRPLSS